MSGIILEIASTLRRYLRPAKDAEYLRFLRRFPCVSCGSGRRIEAAHIGPRGLKQKTSDCLALPLCFMCHQDGKKALHRIGPEAFQAVNGLEFAALQMMFNRFYFLKTGRYAAGWEAEQERRAA
jgi:hypothetical protein